MPKTKLGKRIIKGLADAAESFKADALADADLVVYLPIRTKTEGNANENKWTRINRAKSQRKETALMMAGITLPPLPVQVEFVRLSPATMDDDNLPSSIKHIRDEIAKLYGTGDGHKSPIVWKYDQRKCKRGSFGVMVRIKRMATN